MSEPEELHDCNCGDEVNQGVYDGNIKKFWSVGEEAKHSD